MSPNLKELKAVHLPSTWVNSLGSVTCAISEHFLWFGGCIVLLGEAAAIRECCCHGEVGGVLLACNVWVDCI